MAVNKCLGHWIIILLVVLTLFKRNNHGLWLYIDSQLILKIVNYETTRQRFCALHVLANSLWNVYCLKRCTAYSRKKWELQFYLTKIVHSNGKNNLSLTNQFFLKVSVVRRSCIEIFPPDKVLCIGTRRQIACEMFVVLQLSDKISSQKNNISGSVSVYF